MFFPMLIPPKTHNAFPNHNTAPKIQQQRFIFPPYKNPKKKSKPTNQTNFHKVNYFARVIAKLQGQVRPLISIAPSFPQQQSHAH